MLRRAASCSQKCVSIAPWPTKCEKSGAGVGTCDVPSCAIGRVYSVKSIAVVASGRGSNLQAILDAIAAGTLDAEIVGVWSDRRDALALQRARAAGVPAHLVRPRDYGDRTGHDAALFGAIDLAEPDLIVCAGYMRLIGAAADIALASDCGVELDATSASHAHIFLFGEDQARYLVAVPDADALIAAARAEAAGIATFDSVEAMLRLAPVQVVHELDALLSGLHREPSHVNAPHALPERRHARTHA